MPGPLSQTEISSRDAARQARMPRGALLPAYFRLFSIRLVKTRSSSRFAQAREFVTEAKRRRLRAAASAYLAREGLGEAACRFDVAEVYPGGGWDRPRINYIISAF